MNTNHETELARMLARTLDWIDVDETAGEGPLVLVANIRALLARINEVNQS